MAVARDCAKKSLKKEQSNDIINKTNNERDDIYAERHDTNRKTKLQKDEKSGIYRQGNRKAYNGNAKYTARGKTRDMPLDRREHGKRKPRHYKDRGIVRNAFHGSPYKITKFKKSYVDIGLHFGTYEQAEKRLDGNVGNIKEYDLSLKNPLFTEEIFGEETSQ